MLADTEQLCSFSANNHSKTKSRRGQPLREHGRQLASLTEDGTTWNYTYNSTGLRTERTNGSKTYTYVYNGSQLTYMTVDGHTLWFSYDAHGPMYVKYDGTTYLYVTNLQGDVIAIVNNSGNAVVEYTYDAWGNILSTSGSLKNTLGAYNPLRYRGYVYDSETELYYLESRYYDPAMGRFINADGLVSTGQDILGNNMFAYCGNNPVMGYDPNGMINWGGVLVGLTLGVAAAAAIVLTVATAGAASPLVAAAGVAIGTATSAALVEGAVVTTAGAILEAPVVYDITVTSGNDKVGYSLVYDFSADTADLYGHTGVQNKKTYGTTFGSGFVYNYDKPGDYAGEFYDVSYSTNYKGADIGLDGCTDPKNITMDGFFQKGSYAILLTSGMSVTLDGKTGPYTFSYDYYWQLAVY